MKLPKTFGKIIYLIGYPIIYKKIRGSLRAYVVILVGNKILLTKNWLGLHRDWRLPGGGVNPGEDPLNAVVREVSEEVGIAIDPTCLTMVTKQPHRSKHGYYYHIYTTTLKNQPSLNVCTDEIVKAEFVDYKQLKHHSLSELIVTAQEELGWS